MSVHIDSWASIYDGWDLQEQERDFLQALEFDFIEIVAAYEEIEVTHQPETFCDNVSFELAGNGIKASAIYPIFTKSLLADLESDLPEYISSSSLDPFRLYIELDPEIAGISDRITIEFPDCVFEALHLLLSILPSQAAALKAKKRVQKVAA